MSEKFTVGYTKKIKVHSKEDFYTIEDRFKELQRRDERINRDLRLFGFNSSNDESCWHIVIHTPGGSDFEIGDTYMKAIMSWKEARKMFSKMANELFAGIEYEEEPE